MNEVFLIGKIITDIDFRFIINSKNISVALFEIELLDKQKVKAKAYNEMADFCYSRLKQNNWIFVNGKIESDGLINIMYFSIDKIRLC